MIRRSTVILGLLFFGLTCTYLSCGISIKPLSVCANDSDCASGRLCIGSVCVSAAAQSQNDGSEGTSDSEQVKDTASGERPNAKDSDPQEAKLEPKGEGAQQERPPAPDDIDDESLAVIQDAGNGRESSAKFDDPSRERRFIPEPGPEPVIPPIPDKDMDVVDAKLVDNPMSQGGREGNNGRERGVRPERIPEKAQTDRSVQPFPDKDGDVTTCKAGETQVCFPLGASGCAVSTSSCYGICRLGKRTCEKGKWSDCKGFKLPEKPKCNGKDNNCDGLIDGSNGRCP